MSVRVVIADDQQLIRDAFRMILAAEDDIEVVGEASTGSEAVAIAASSVRTTVLMDIRMPDLDGIKAAPHHADGPRPATRILILTTFDLDEYVYDALRYGASGFLLKEVPKHQLIAGIEPSATATHYSLPACPPPDRGIRDGSHADHPRRQPDVNSHHARARSLPTPRDGHDKQRDR